MRNTHDELQAKFLSNPENKAEYDKLESEYKAIDEQLKNKLYNSKLTNDRKWLMDNFDAVLDKYILTLDGVYHFSGKITSANRICLDGVNLENNPQTVPMLDVEWEEIDPWDKDPSTQTIAEGTAEVKLDRWGLKVLAWAYSREIISGLEFKMMMDSGHVFPKLDQYQDQIIDEILKRNDWEFLKEREVTSE